MKDLSRMTKAELINEYQNMLGRQKEMESAAKLSFSEERTDVIETAKKEHKITVIDKTAQTLRQAATAGIDSFIESLESETRRFEELQKVIVHTEERLSLLRELEWSAEVATKLIEALKAEKMTLEEEIERKRRDFTRDHEEKEYQMKVTQRRSEEEAFELQKKRELVLKDKEAQVLKKEKDIELLVKRLETLDAEVEKEVAKRITEIKKQWESDREREQLESDRERELDAKLREVENIRLQEDIKRLESECANLRKEAEQANKRAQDLALKIIENAGRDRVTGVVATEK